MADNVYGLSSCDCEAHEDRTEEIRLLAILQWALRRGGLTAVRYPCRASSSVKAHNLAKIEYSPGNWK